MSTQTSDATVPQFELRHRLDRSMEWADLKPEDMAVEIGRSITTIRNYLSGRTIPTRGTVTAWAVRCKVDRDWLLYGIESTGPENGDVTRGSAGSGCFSRTAGDNLAPVVPLRKAA